MNRRSPSPAPDLDRHGLLGPYARDVRERIGALEAWLDAAARRVPRQELRALAPKLADAAQGLRGGAAAGGLGRLRDAAVLLEHALDRLQRDTDGATADVTAAVGRLLPPLRALADSTLGRDVDPAAPVVLHVEGTASTGELVRRILLRRGDAALVTTRTVEVGATLAEDLRPAVVLLELELPDASGEELLRALRGQPRTAEIPVVVLDGGSHPAKDDRLRAAGASDVLPEPLDEASLERAVGRALRTA